MHLLLQINQPWHFWGINTILAFLLKLCDKTSLNPVKQKLLLVVGAFFFCEGK